MAWETSRRKQELPSNWVKLRRKVLYRDRNECQGLVDGLPCLAHANNVDHIIPGNDHSLDNLQSLCERCHAIKSTREGHEAYAKKREDISNRFRVSEDDPRELLLRSLRQATERS